MSKRGKSGLVRERGGLHATGCDDGRKGHLPRDAGGMEKLGKAQNFLLLNFRKEMQPPEMTLAL